MEVDGRIKVFILIANACSIVAVNAVRRSASLNSSRGMVCDLREATFDFAASNRVWRCPYELAVRR